MSDGAFLFILAGGMAFSADSFKEGVYRFALVTILVQIALKVGAVA